MSLPNAYSWPGKVRLEMSELGISRPELANHLGYSPTAVDSWMKGLTQPRDLPATLRQIADYLGWHDDWILGWLLDETRHWVPKTALKREAGPTTSMTPAQRRVHELADDPEAADILLESYGRYLDLKKQIERKLRLEQTDA